ncbi:MAG: hypothetical protein M1170_01040 [Patescibacteria group bacterium]|nr:hypothetical protein [Patescibacteria group bacterium]
MIRNVLWFLLAFCIFTVGVEVMAEDLDVPTIKNLSVVREGSFYKFSFDFFNVRGGLAKADFTVGYRIVRDGVIIREYIEDVRIDVAVAAETIRDAMSLIKETGKFETKMFTVKKTQKTLKTGDRIIYFIILSDEDGRKSNVAACEFTFAELIEI